MNEFGHLVQQGADLPQCVRHLIPRISMTGPRRGCLAPATVGGIKVIMTGQCIFSRRHAGSLALATRTMAYASARAGAAAVSAED